jgi:hypothetical protein
LLEQAKSGAIVGIAGAVAFPSVEGYCLPASTFSAGFCVSEAVVGSLERIKYSLLRDQG